MLASIPLLWILAPAPAGAADVDDAALITLHTVSDLQHLRREVELLLLLDGRHQDLIASKGFDTLLVPLTIHLDLNVLGRGESWQVDPFGLAQEVMTALDEGRTLSEAGHRLVGTSSMRNVRSSATESADVEIGGFFVVEVEYHQEPDGEFLPLLEINQTRLYFSADLGSPDGANHPSFLAEWNPIPEEVVHQIESFEVDDYTLAVPERDIEGPIQFERLHVRIDRVAGQSVNLTLGQFRLPFGVWSDYTSHRNFTTTKSNALVNGFALKKIELGGMAQIETSGGFSVKAAVMHGRFGRTSPLDRADRDAFVDAVIRPELRRGALTVGASAYFAELRARRIALGLDATLVLPRFSSSVEVVYQRNRHPAEVYGVLPVGVDLDRIESLGAYVQFDVGVSSRLRPYGMAEIWSLSVNGDHIAPPAGKLFLGLRYQVHRNLRWILLEYGRMFHKGFDRGHQHVSTQLEVTL